MPISIHQNGLSRSVFFFLAIWFAALSVAQANASDVVTTPEVDIAFTPLYGTNVNLHPNMILALSVEFPTVGIAYRGDNGSYKRDVSYIGYFNPLKCYTYSGGDHDETGEEGYFKISSAADPVTHECDGKSFSGNFMNWASSSAIDMMRYALTGGDRVVDTTSMTILQRAYLPDDFYARDNMFPRRSIAAGGDGSAPSQVTPFDVPRLYIVSCRNRIFFSDVVGTTDTCTSSAFEEKNGNGGNNGNSGKSGNKGNSTTLVQGDKYRGEYFVRVQVCDATEGPVRTDLCKAYGSIYKPVGEIQRNAEKVRFAAMSYLADDAMTRYGGVLRAPMKYVGPKKFVQPGFIEEPNANLEWDSSTGIFIENPEKDTLTANSGVINYLNKFGRTADTKGRYKAYDPVGELYYEAIRYLQGKQPTADATADMTTDMQENFSIVRTWADPVVASCQKNYIVTIADVNTHFDYYIPGNTRTTRKNGNSMPDVKRDIDAVVTGKTPELDVMEWTSVVGEMEADATDTYGNSSKRPGLAGLDMLDTGSQGEGSYYMAGLAYWANTHNIRIDKPTRVRTFVVDVDEGGNGQMDNNSRVVQPRDSQLYLAAKYGGFIDSNDDGNPFAISVDDKVSNIKKVVKGVDTEWDADGNGIPDTYFLAGQPQILIDSIREIFTSVANMSGTISGVATSGTKVLTSGAYVYQPGFDASSWSGSLKQLKVTLQDTGEITVASKEEWDAGKVLTGTSPKDAKPAPADRKIYTAITDTDKPFSTIAFDWASLTASQRTLLNTNPLANTDDGLGEQRVAYLRGVRTNEEGANGGIFRARNRVLGDIINSNPVYVGAPSLNVRGGGYSVFYDKYKTRKEVVYIGANDGMLHAFDASNGEEVFAYIPEMVLSRLNALTDPSYVHRPYVDGVMTVVDAQLGSDWKTVLVSGMGGGVQGVFALDVTDPSTFGTTHKAIWEFTDSDDADMGNVLGTPVIAKFRTGTKSGVATYRYFAVVASGFNNNRHDGDTKYNDAAPGALFLLALDKSTSTPWEKGNNYFKFVMPISDPALQNGLSAPATVVGSDGAVRYVYAGDLQGNLWRLDFTGDAPWSSALGSETSSALGSATSSSALGSATPYQPIFIARDKNDVRQPITMQPRVVFAPDGYVVLFGTGKFIEGADVAPGNFKRQSFYAIHDTTNDKYKLTDRSRLVKRTATTSTDGKILTITGDTFTYGISAPNMRGWYLDFVDAETTGERSVTTPLALYGRVFFNTLIPGADVCAAGSGRSYSLDALSGLPGEGGTAGGTTGGLSTIGYLGSPMLMEAGETEVGDRNAIGQRDASRTYSIFNFGTDGAQKGLTTKVYPPAGRFSWRELLNWQELRNAITK